MSDENQFTVGGFCWNELASPDVKKAKDFYGKVFGWQFHDVDMGGMMYTLIKLGEKDIGGIWAIPQEQKKEIPPHWMSYILVENIEASLEKAKKQGASVVKPVTQVGDAGRLAILIDPTGAHIALWEKSNKK